MKNLLAELYAICRRHLLAEKIVLVPSHSLGNQLLQGLAAEGYASINLRVMTLPALAQQLLEPYLYRDGFSVLSATEAITIMESTLLELSRNGGLAYFSGLEVTPSLARAMLSAVEELKLAGTGPGDLEEDCFVTPEKGMDIKNIFAAYEQRLRENKLLFQADLYKLAVDRGCKKKALFIVPSLLKLRQVEREFVQTATGGEWQAVHVACVHGLEKPGTFFVASRPEGRRAASSNRERLAWLYDQENAPPPLEDDSVQVFHAYGQSSEVKEVLRRIKSEKIPLDRAAVFYTVQEPYAQLFFNFCRRLGLQVTFGQGVNVKNTRPGRVLFSFLEWIGRDYAVSVFYPLLAGDAFDSGEKYSQLRLARLIRSSAIGWGRDRYLACLDREIAASEEKINARPESEHYQRKHDDLLSLRQLCADILSRLPVPGADGLVPYASLAAGLAELVKKYGAVQNELDQEAKEVITRELAAAAGSTGETLPVEEVLLRLQDLAGRLRVGSSTPRPGCLHVDHYQRGVWTCRPHAFIVGLEAGCFPGQEREDAILLDAERKRISPGLFLHRDRQEENTYEMAQLLTSLPGRVTLSCPAFDTVENRELFPAPVLLQVFRLLSGDQARDYTELAQFLGPQAGFFPVQGDGVLDEGEWWLQRKAGGYSLETVLDAYEFLRCGLHAWCRRNSPGFTEYDGRVGADTGALDPRGNHRLVMSSSQLETLAACPFKYFLRHVLGVEKPVEVEYDPGAWLDPLTRGVLLHRIFERFYSQLDLTREKPCLDKHEKFLWEIAGELVEEQKQSLPPPGTVVFENERAEILESCRVFLAGEEEHCRDSLPVHLEQAFGLEQGNPVAIELPSGGKFYLQGKIDRVDQATDSSYRIFDYKTGSANRYSPREYFKGGRQLQHALYALAVEKLFAVEVSASGYIFPTVRGEGQRIIRPHDRREELLAILDDLLEIIARGTFVMADDDGNCPYCDYRPVCERETWRDVFEGKIKDPALEPLRRIREYE